MNLAIKIFNWVYDPKKWMKRDFEYFNDSDIDLLKSELNDARSDGSLYRYMDCGMMFLDGKYWKNASAITQTLSFKYWPHYFVLFKLGPIKIVRYGTEAHKLIKQKVKELRYEATY